jgi:hypothetical protein
MPSGILIIMKRKSYLFNSAEDINLLIKQYFLHIQGHSHTGQKNMNDPITGKPTCAEVEICDRQPEPPTITGMALFLGFNSRQEFENYEKRGTYAAELKRARLRIEAEYEKKLHQQSPAAAIFALKSMGWNEKTDDNTLTATPASQTLTIKIIETGPTPAASEKEVALD